MAESKPCSALTTRLVGASVLAGVLGCYRGGCLSIVNPGSWGADMTSREPYRLQGARVLFTTVTPQGISQAKRIALFPWLDKERRLSHLPCFLPPSPPTPTFLLPKAASRLQASPFLPQSTLCP